MLILGIDPGPKTSGWCLFDGERVVSSSSEARNEDVLDLLMDPPQEFGVAIEMIESHGMPVGREVFATCLWIGRFLQAWSPRTAELISRRSIKLELCGSMRAKDGNVRQALLDRVGPVGTKGNRGPCYGVSKHAWSALAVAVTAAAAYMLRNAE